MFQQTKQPARYYNANGYAMAVVAVVNNNGLDLFDWAAYMGGCSSDLSEQEALNWVARFGCKLGQHDAAHFFPDLPIALYRD